MNESLHTLVPLYEKKRWGGDGDDDEGEGFKYLHRSKHHSIGGLPVFAVVVEGFEQQLRSGGRREVQPHHFHVGQRSQRREQRHCFTGSGRAAEH